MKDLLQSKLTSRRVKDYPDGDILASEYASILLDEWGLCTCAGNISILTRRLLPLATETVELIQSEVSADARTTLLSICASADTQYIKRNKLALMQGLHKVGARSAVADPEEREERGIGQEC